VPEVLPLELSNLVRDGYAPPLPQSQLSPQRQQQQQQSPQIQKQLEQQGHVAPHVISADTMQKMDLTEFKNKFIDVQKKSNENIEKIRQSNIGIVKKKNADLDFMVRILENYKNLLIKIENECCDIESQTMNIQTLISKEGSNDNELVSVLCRTLKNRSNTRLPKL